ncbi:MAG: T9SS type A sorting domain-containing protein, partial [Candidatus Kapaibacterium sp.]
GKESDYWIIGQMGLIKWNVNNFPNNVNIYLWDGSQSKYHVIASNIPGSKGSYQWLVKGEFQPGKFFRVKVQAQNSAYYQMSEFFFPIYYEHQAGQNPIPLTNEDIFVSPNPASDNISISWSNDHAIKLEMIDLEGHRIRELSYFNEKGANLNIEDLKNGVYIIKVYFLDGRYASGKFIKVKK